MATDNRKVCFVVMGFGKKTDYESGRTLDLDATYEAIIKPAADSLNLRCIRADEIMHSGIIDVEVFEMLLRAELVVADISTGNVNALYELGVRHALRPNSTIIMKEAAGRLYFDLSHTSTFLYTHMGEDIATREAKRATTVLKELISAVLTSDRPDSPVYTYLPRLQKPLLSEEQYKSLLDEAEAAQEHLSYFIKKGDYATRQGAHAEAAQAFRTALEMKPGEPYLVQQLALNIYKSKQPSVLSALIDARTILEDLAPITSNDPETLGITGAVHKHIWLETKDVQQLNLAVRYYRRGYEIKRDYYNGENLATCLALRARVQTASEEATYDRMSAQKVRESLIELLTPVVASESFLERSDRRWILATLANASFALSKSEQGNEYEARFLAEDPAQWEIDTYMVGKELLDPAS